MAAKDVEVVTLSLALEFSDRLALSTVARVIGSAERDLRGQVPLGGYAELVHRLARVRLNRLAAA